MADTGVKCLLRRACVGPEESSFVGDADAVGQTIVASVRSAIFDLRAGCFDHAIDASDALEQGTLVSIGVEN